MPKNNFLEFTSAGETGRSPVRVTLYPKWVMKYWAHGTDTSKPGMTVRLADGSDTKLSNESYDAFKLTMIEMGLET